MALDYRLYETGITLRRKKRHYYHTTGRFKHQNKEKKWMAPFAPVFENLSRVSAKTTDINQFNQHVTILLASYHPIWREVTKPRHRRMNLHCHIMCRQYFGQLGQELRHPFLSHPDEDPIVGMGNAKLQASMRGTLSAPVEYVQREIRKRAVVIYADENRTSIICSDCGKLTRSVVCREGHGYPHPVRGEVHCNSITCRQNQSQIKDRDRNGYCGIAIKLIHDPSIYRRGDGQCLTKLRGRHYINNGNREQELVLRQSDAYARFSRRNESIGFEARN